MKPDPRQEWSIFREALVAELQCTPRQDIARAWDKSHLRTAFYRKNLFPRLARRLGLTLVNEQFRIDHKLLKPHAATGEEVPWVYIESENNARTAKEEVRKLCGLFAPIKLLVICHEWTDEADYWKKEGKRGDKQKLLPEWLAILQAHHEINPQPHVFGILVGECNRNNFRFYLMAYHEGRQELDPETIILEFKLPIV